VFEGFTDRERKTRALGAPALDWAEYNQALWRKVNDAIIWSLVGQQRHVIKRLCLYHARPMLSQSNPESVLRVLNKVNANPRSLAIWNDATSCVDISDVTYIEDGMKPNPVFWELKEGVVNDEIMTLVTSGTEGAADKIQALHERRGEKGLAQLERFLRQTMTARSALTLLREEKGIDPVTGAHTRIISVESALEVWDKTLGEVANEALRKSGPATGAVDQCLWIYADATPELSRHEAMARFQHWLVKNVPASAATFQ
jgi:hypothetical protein